MCIDIYKNLNTLQIFCNFSSPIYLKKAEKIKRQTTDRENAANVLMNTYFHLENIKRFYEFKKIYK